MSEAVFNVVAFGRQADIGTAVAATTIFPVDSGFLGFELDRASESPESDYGLSSREYPGMESHGVRWATASMPFVARYQDIMHVLEMHVDTIGTPTGTAAPYQWVYTFDETGNLLSSALKPYTIEYGVDGSTQDEWRAVGVIADTLELGFDALSAPGNSMWKGSVGLVALDREYQAMTGTATVPDTLETMEGHFTTLAEGTTATAFADLTVLSGSLKSFSLSSSLGAAGRVYGGTTDKAVTIGRSARGEVTFDALIGISATSKTDIHDIYNVSGALAGERRWRLVVDGTGSNSLTIDFRCRFRSVNVGDHENERLYAVNGVWVYDSTLAGRGKFTLGNAVTVIP